LKIVVDSFSCCLTDYLNTQVSSCCQAYSSCHVIGRLTGGIHTTTLYCMAETNLCPLRPEIGECSTNEGTATVLPRYSPAVLLDNGLGIHDTYHAMPSLPRNPPIRRHWTRESVIPLSSVQSLYDCRAEVIITHTPSTSDACETHARPVEKFIACPTQSKN